VLSITLCCLAFAVLLLPERVFRSQKKEVRMAQKVVLTLSDDQGYGWSETYYYLGSSTPPLADTINLVYYRNQFLSATAIISYARITSAVKRNPYIIQFATSQGALAGPAAPDFAALLVRQIATSVGYGRHFLRGIPAANVQEDDYVPTPAFNSALIAWGSYLQGGLWGIRSTLNGAGPRQPVTMLSPNGNKGYTFQIVGAQVFNLGDSLVMHGAKVIGYNGTKVIVATPYANPGATGFIYTVGGAAPATTEAPSSSPWATKVNVTYGAINQVITERITHRPPGRIFGSRRGRRNSLVPLRQ
jgi:hypothetical protein